MRRAVVLVSIVAASVAMAVPAGAAGPYTWHGTFPSGGNGSADGSWTATGTADAGGAFDLTATASDPTLAINGTPAWGNVDADIANGFDGLAPGKYTATVTVNVASAQASADGLGRAAVQVSIALSCNSCAVESGSNAAVASSIPVIAPGSVSGSTVVATMTFTKSTSEWIAIDAVPQTFASSGLATGLGAAQYGSARATFSGVVSAISVTPAI